MTETKASYSFGKFLSVIVRIRSWYVNSDPGMYLARSMWTSCSGAENRMDVAETRSCRNRLACFVTRISDRIDTMPCTACYLRTTTRFLLDTNKRRDRISATQRGASPRFLLWFKLSVNANHIGWVQIVCKTPLRRCLAFVLQFEFVSSSSSSLESSREKHKPQDLQSHREAKSGAVSMRTHHFYPWAAVVRAFAPSMTLRNTQSIVFDRGAIHIPQWCHQLFLSIHVSISRENRTIPKYSVPAPVASNTSILSTSTFSTSPFCFLTLTSRLHGFLWQNTSNTMRIILVFHNSSSMISNRTDTDVEYFYAYMQRNTLYWIDCMSFFFFFISSSSSSSIKTPNEYFNPHLREWIPWLKVFSPFPLLILFSWTVWTEIRLTLSLGFSLSVQLRVASLLSAMRLCFVYFRYVFKLENNTSQMRCRSECPWSECRYVHRQNTNRMKGRTRSGWCFPNGHSKCATD